MVLISLVDEFVSPKTVYTSSSFGDYSIPQSLKCTHSSTQLTNDKCTYYNPLLSPVSALRWL